MNSNLQDDLEKEDEVKQSSATITPNKGINGFVQKHSKIIMLVPIVIVVVIGLIWLIRSNNAKNEANASKILARIEQYYAKGEYENALFGNDSLPLVRGEKVIGLVEIVKEYGTTLAGNRAALYAADAYFNLEKFSEAKIYYEKALKSNIDVVVVGGLAGSAACNEKNGNYKEAAEEYAKAYELIMDDTQKMRYMYFAGLCAEKANEKEEALQVYKDIVALNKYGEFNNLAKAGIIRLGSEIE